MVAELASHIAEIFTWYQGTFNVDEFNLAKYIYDKGDISQSSNIFQKFEINFAEAKKAIEDSDEANYWPFTQNTGNKRVPLQSHISSQGRANCSP